MLRHLAIISFSLSLFSAAGAQAPDRNALPPGPENGEFGPRPDAPPPNAMFDVIDSDGDGTITTRELRKAVLALRKLDADNDGNITRAEAMRGPAEDQAAAIEHFMQHDRNGDDLLTENELPRNLVQLLAGADTNRDHAIDRAELTAAIQAGVNPLDPRGLQFGDPNAPAGRNGRVGDPRRAGPDLMQYDRNGDGQLSPGEVPLQLRRSLQGADKNRDGLLDAQEIEAVHQRMRGQRPLPPGTRIGPQGIERTPPQP